MKFIEKQKEESCGCPYSCKKHLNPKPESLEEENKGISGSNVSLCKHGKMRVNLGECQEKCGKSTAEQNQHNTFIENIRQQECNHIDSFKVNLDDNVWFCRDCCNSFKPERIEELGMNTIFDPSSADYTIVGKINEIVRKLNNL